MSSEPTSQPTTDPATPLTVHTDPYQYDTVTRRVQSIFYAEFNRAYPRRPSREMENVCPGCGGDGCEPCDWTGEVA